MNMKCTDFSTQEEAQEYFEANGGPDYDPDDLDLFYGVASGSKHSYNL